MPNWCYNRLEISGPEESLKKFYLLLVNDADKRMRELNESSLDREEYISLLKTFLPISEYFQSMEGFNNGGYEWCLENWGTKWSERIQSSFFDKQEWELIFETAWAPPLAGYYKISEIFSDLMFTHYFEDEGLLFAGAHVYQNGIAIHEYETNEFDDYLATRDEEFDEEYFDMGIEKMRKDFWEEAKKSFTFSI